MALHPYTYKAALRGRFVLESAMHVNRHELIASAIHVARGFGRVGEHALHQAPSTIEVIEVLNSHEGVRRGNVQTKRVNAA